MFKAFGVTCVVCLSSISVSVEAAAICTPAQLNERWNIDLNSWENVYLFYKRYRQCDDVEYSEMSVVDIPHMMVEKWTELDKLEAYSKQSPGFRAFLLTHISESSEKDDLIALDALSRDRCTIATASLCRAINQHVKGILASEGGGDRLLVE